MDLNREIAVVEPTTRSIYPTVAEKSKQRLAELRQQVAEVEAELSRLTAQRDRLQQRRDAANELASKCRDYLRERSALPRNMEF